LRNIYDILNERQEDMLDIEYEGIQEGYDEVILLDKSICVTLEELVYNNPEKKKLSVLMEEVEANESNKTNNIINKLKEQMQKVLQWLTNMFKHYEKAFAEGADFVKNNDLNQCMNRLKSKNIQDTVNYHPFKSPFKHMKTICMRGIKIDNFITKRAHNGANDATGEWADDNLSSGDKTENYLEGLLKKFKFDKDNLKEMSLTKVNVILIMNNLSQLPEANKELERMKSKVQRMYNGAINDIRQRANTNNDKKALNTGNELSFVNSQLKKINERIRAYSKIMTMVFKEDYNLAKLIVSKAS
jgi:hypothetical protein